MKNTTLEKIFAENVFTDAEMEKRVSKEAYESYRKTVDENVPLKRAAADEIAKAMMAWAMEKGATHYTHWFQPMTGVTAEKHESFIEPDGKGGVITKFSGKMLVKGEPDASSFPSGGLRSTFEARGYTAWDPSSKAFVRDGSLYIPTVFCSYGGESLDKKTPLLKSIEALNKQVLRIMRIFGDEETKKIIPTVGAEQEYFLVDKDVYENRLDLATCGRTLFGAHPPKGQELEDHYFGKIKQRVWDYMTDLDEELWKLGVYAKTKHNEVAPAQHELACVYAPSNDAVDHNQIVMSVMKSVANRHGMVCLLHEKPFDGINGSGKHNNWSMATDRGENLLDPTDHPENNTRFLLFLAAVITAADKYQDLLRISVASAGNDHRLGANEAPPAIVSMFIGEELEGILSSLERGAKYSEIKAEVLKITSGLIPKFDKDKTDRNRTSPFAFTGNKFEFRMVGSDMSVSAANVVINTAVADALKDFADEIENSSDKNAAIIDIIRKSYAAHKRIVFNGNNYSDEWVKEAEKRGLLNLKTTVDALPYYLEKKNIDLFVRHGVLTETEVKSRYEIQLDTYIKIIDVEAKTMARMARREILPASIGYSDELANGLSAKAAIGIDIEKTADNRLIARLMKLNDKLLKAIEKLEKAITASAKIKEALLLAQYHRDVMIPDMDDLRKIADELETIVDKAYWSFPTYTEILTSVMY
mgnify:FL=1